MPCPECAYQPAPNEYIPAPTSRKFAAGDICAVPESIKVPFLLLFQQTRRELVVPNATSQNTLDASAENLLTPESPTGSQSPTNSRYNHAIARSLQSIESRETAAYPRPCLLIAAHRPGSKDHPRVFLFGTFGNHPMRTLPRAFQCFCIPLYPNLGMDDTNAEGHLHAFPEWPGDKMAWLVAHPFPTKRPVNERWYHRDESGSFSKCSKLDKGQRDKLNTIRRRLLGEWRQKCQTPGYLDACETEFLSNEWRNDEGWKSMTEHSRPADLMPLD